MFNTDVYTIENIRKTCEAYKNYAVIRMKTTKDYAILTFSNCQFSEKQTVKEFENYLIGIENI